MTSDRDKCGLSSLLPMSCRGRAEAFARRLHSRLRSLGSEDGNGSADESSWLAAHENPIAISQPRHSSETDMYFDFGVLESPGSPEDEIEGNELEKLINKENLKHSHSEDCHCSVTKEKKIPLLNSVKTTSNDSDSDGPYYDTENDLDQRIVVRNHVNCINSSDAGSSLSDSESETKEIDSQITSNCTEELYATSSECTIPPQSSSISEDVSTLSLKDDEYGSLELNGLLPDLPHYTEILEEIEDNKTICEVISEKTEFDDTETYRSCLNIDKDLTVEYPKDVQLLEKEECVEIEIKDQLKDGDNDDEDVEERIPRVRRCSSLKTGKTPPDTPGSKKIVRFADVLGLDLADVRTFLDEIPKVPNSAYHDLRDADLNDDDHNVNTTATKFHGIKVDKVLLPLFQQPGGQPNFLDKVRDHLVCLENALVQDPSALSITGTVRVRNLDFHKSVHIRYTLNSWHSFADVKGVYVENSCDGFSDKFTFLIYAHTLTVGQRLEFAVRFQCKGAQYWDNNNGVNYCFQCLPASNNTPYSPITGIDDSWGASFYYQEDTSDSTNADTTTTELTHTEVQEIITNSLGMKKSIPKKQTDIFTVFVILIFSFLFVYIQKAIYFME